jgi:hypothetical protein
MTKDMQAKHTPGPWKAITGQGAHHRDWYIRAGEKLPGAIHPPAVARTCSSGVGGMSCVEANARLIASAPDLLAALEALVKDAAECEVDGEPSQVDGIQWDDVLAARAAIAKARNQ